MKECLKAIVRFKHSAKQCNYTLIYCTRYCVRICHTIILLQYISYIMTYLHHAFVPSTAFKRRLYRVQCRRFLELSYCYCWPNRYPIDRYTNTTRGWWGFLFTSITDRLPWRACCMNTLWGINRTLSATAADQQRLTSIQVRISNTVSIQNTHFQRSIAKWITTREIYHDYEV